MFKGRDISRHPIPEARAVSSRQIPSLLPALSVTACGGMVAAALEYPSAHSECPKALLLWEMGGTTAFMGSYHPAATDYKQE
ncbi:MAG: hypothetical protein H6560_19475 [Lewinellaceae bacterium]|nr:hypothetical protein [Lewinellaceae bacterium]